MARETVNDSTKTQIVGQAVNRLNPRLEETRNALKIMHLAAHWKNLQTLAQCDRSRDQYNFWPTLLHESPTIFRLFNNRPRPNCVSSNHFGCDILHSTEDAGSLPVDRQTSSDDVDVLLECGRKRRQPVLRGSQIH